MDGVMMKCKTRARFSAREKQSSGSGVNIKATYLGTSFQRYGQRVSDCRFYFDFG